MQLGAVARVSAPEQAHAARPLPGLPKGSTRWGSWVGAGFLSLETPGLFTVGAVGRLASTEGEKGVGQP